MTLVSVRVYALYWDIPIMREVTAQLRLLKVLPPFPQYTSMTLVSVRVHALY
jgi:hypothetical protein